jgi:acetyl-CoA synthetase
MTESNVETLSLIEGLVKEQRTFPPSDEFRRSAIISDDSVYREADRDFEGFWSRLAHEFLTWFEAPTQGLEWRPPHCTWFADGILNASVNCLDRHVAAGRGERVAYHWEGETPGEARTVTYADLLREVCRLANGLKALGVRRGDRVGIYMGMVRSFRPRCWRAPGSARRTSSSSAGSPPSRSPSAFATRAPSS